MAAKEISVKKYVVRLSGEERERLETLIRKGKSPARRVLKARILLKADVSEAGKGWSDNRIIDALETSPSMVYRVRKQLVEEDFEAVLSRKPRAMPAVARIPYRACCTTNARVVVTCHGFFVGGDNPGNSPLQP
jgi:Homeodomain-like domain